ncbi:hypothetical protein EYF80_036551 [Liparis tanakae]|uniref:Uncharacterized protein n=1 Tax=Liparis tanakae TaxID=230148 RepID=A0A4Z2GIZ4_9TELE|nr:hypothetical protein EYF80_036551 [Liparis tanakae]
MKDTDGRGADSSLGAAAPNLDTPHPRLSSRRGGRFLYEKASDWLTGAASDAIRCSRVDMKKCFNKQR